MSMVAYKAPYLLQVMQDDEPLNPREDYDNFGKMVCWHNRYNLGDKHDYEDTNELFMRLVLHSISADTVIDYVKSGKSDTAKLSYDNNEKGWEVSGYDGHFKCWWSDSFYEGTIEEHKQEIFESLVDVMSNKDLYVLASERNVILPLNLYDHSGISMSVSSFLGKEAHAQWDSGQVGWILATPEDVQKEYGNLSPESYAKAKSSLEGEVETYDLYLQGQCYGFRLYEKGEETDSCWGMLGRQSDVMQEIVTENLPETHQDMIDNFHEVSDTVTYDKGYEDYMEEFEEMEA